MLDYVNVSDRIAQRATGESWIESIAAGIAAIVLFCLLVLVLAFFQV